jgi:transposase
MIQNKSEIIIDAIKRVRNGESLRSIARDWKVSRPTLTQWLADESGTLSSQLREHRIKHVNNLFRQGLSGPEIAKKVRMSLATVEKYKTPETKALLKTQLQSRRNWAREQLALGKSRKEIVEASDGKLSYSDLGKIARGKVK